jgi:hypothetical protein
METLKKKDILQDVLTQNGFSGWYVIDTGSAHTEDCLLFNPKEKKIGEVSIPDEWLDDPHRQTTIGESFTKTIHNCSHILPEEHPSSSRLSRS